LAESRPTRVYAGLEITGADPDFVLAEVDGLPVLAVEDVPGGQRLFFATPIDRDAAMPVLLAAFPGAALTPVDVPDEQWAERSQASLTAVRVGRITVAPPWDVPVDDSIVVTILPSMGFGTGHHASTRLCLALLQQITLTDRRVVDVGTGSGVLAIAALRLGAVAAVAIDYDHDAIVCAQESAELNHIIDGLDIRQVDLERDAAPAGAPFDVVLANLTGGMLTRLVTPITALVAPGGTLILSGITTAEADDVIAAFGAAGCPVGMRLDEDGWVGLRLPAPVRP
jgi:ribosomal protein L11 methyltransferase